MKDFSHGFETASPFTYSINRYHSKDSRRDPTVAEIRLWECLRGKQLGVKFRRQHVIDEYIADFVCLDEMLVVEVDGEYHFTDEQKEADQQRTERLNSLGYRVIRFSNDEVIFKIDEVLDSIRKYFIFSSQNE